MKKIIDWFYWEGNRIFVIACFPLGFLGLVLGSIESTVKIGSGILLGLCALMVIFLVFDRWYEDKQRKNFEEDEENS